MQNELCTEITAALSREDVGVGAQLARLEIYEGDERPRDPQIVDGSRSDNAVQGEQLPENAADILLLVTPDGPTRYEDAKIRGLGSDGKTPIAITAFHRGSRQPAEKVRDVGYVLRAVIICLQRYFELQVDQRPPPNGVNILRFTGLTVGLIQHDGLGGLGAAVFTIEALDKRAQRLI